MKKINKSNIIIIIALVFAGLLVFGAIYLSGKKGEDSKFVEQKVEEENVNNVSIVDGKQIIQIKAKNGFSPVHSFAKAGISTIVRVDTNGTFDCSSVMRIPSLNISKNLPMSGTTDVDLGIQNAGTLEGTCGMGMYPFDIKFE